MQQECSDILTELESWYARDVGRYLQQQALATTRDMLDMSFGYHILQLGLRGAQPLCDASPIRHRFYSAERPAEGVDLLAHPDDLPLESDSVDTVILHHTLEFARRPHDVLREVQRVLTPQGQVLVVGFNPYSLLGAYARSRGLLRDPLWRNHYPVGEKRLADWLCLLGCEVREIRYLCSLPPAGSGRLRNWLARADSWAAGHNLPTGGVYLLHATKQVVGLTGQRRARRERRLIGLVPRPAARPSPVPQRYKVIDKGDVAA